MPELINRYKTYFFQRQSISVIIGDLLQIEPLEKNHLRNRSQNTNIFVQEIF